MTPVAVITGASSGIGANAAARIAAAGCEVAVVGRNAERTRAVADTVGGTAFLTDFDSLDAVRELAASLGDRYEHIDVLANNAGGLIHERGVSADGYERTIQHNHLAPFLLTNLLLPRLTGSRVIGTASVANTFGSLRIDDLQWQKRPWLGGWRAYGTSKIATILFGRELARRAPVESYTFHPGYVATSFGHESALVRLGSRVAPGRISITAEEGATPLVHLATVEDTGVPNGTYFDRMRPNGRVNRVVNQPGIAEALWAESERLVGLSPS